MAAALDELERRRELTRASNRRVALRTLPRQTFEEMTARSDSLRRTTWLVDVSGRRPDPEALVRRLQRAHPSRLALGGVLAARHYDAAFDLHGTPRIDLTSWVVRGAVDDDARLAKLNPGLKASTTRQDEAIGAVHRIVRAEPSFEESPGSLPYADTRGDAPRPSRTAPDRPGGRARQAQSEEVPRRAGRRPCSTGPRRPRPDRRPSGSAYSRSVAPIGVHTSLREHLLHLAPRKPGCSTERGGAREFRSPRRRAWEGPARSRASRASVRSHRRGWSAHAARSLGIGIVTLERATDAYALLPLSTVRRLNLAINRLGTSP